MKIKTEKRMNLPKLIEWAWKNNIENKEFKAKDNYTEVIFGDDGDFSLGQMGFVEENDIFTVEIEEDITEHSIFNELVALRGDSSYWKYEDASIYDFNKEKIKAIYIPNDDFTMTLIWTKEKGLVE